jgi:hypothetical protein
MSSSTPTTKYIPDPEQPDDVGTTHSWNHKLYRDQVGSGAPWDTTFAFRYAVAHAKDRARNELIKTVRREARRLQEESRSNLTTFLKDDSLSSFNDQAKDSVLTQRKIDGVDGLPDDAIKL